MKLTANKSCGQFLFFADSIRFESAAGLYNVKIHPKAGKIYRRFLINFFFMKFRKIPIIFKPYVAP